MNDVRLDLQQVPARAELRARGDAAAGRGEPTPRGGAAQSVCQSHLLRRGARRGRVARQRAGRACRLQEAPLAGRAAAVAPQTWAPAEACICGHPANSQRAAGSLLARERLELHGAAALADEALPAIL